MRLKYRLFISAFVLQVGLNLGSLFILPDGVAIHFNSGGVPDDWIGKEASVLIVVAISALVFAGLFLSTRVLKGVPDKYISLPNKEYWLAEENREEAGARFSGLMYEFGIATFLLLAFMSVFLIRANLSDPVRFSGRLFFPFFIFYMAYTVWWCVRIFIAFKIPKE